MSTNLSSDVCVSRGERRERGRVTVVVTARPNSRSVPMYGVRVSRALVPSSRPFPVAFWMRLMRNMRFLTMLSLLATATGSGRYPSTSAVRAIQYGPPRNQNPRFCAQKRASPVLPAPAPPPPPPPTPTPTASARLGAGAGAGAPAPQEHLDANHSATCAPSILSLIHI